MVATFAVQIKRHRNLADTQRQFNQIIREVLIETGQYWAREFLPKHFEPGASGRYGYAPREERTRRIKRYAKQVHRWDGAVVPLADNPRPLVFTGELIEDVLGRDPANFSVRATATSNRQRVVVKVPLPHPLNPKNKGEVTRLIPSELRAMHRFATRRLKEKMAALRTSTQTTTIGRT